MAVGELFMHQHLLHRVAFGQSLEQRGQCGVFGGLECVAFHVFQSNAEGKVVAVAILLPVRAALMLGALFAIHKLHSFALGADVEMSRHLQSRMPWKLR